MSVPALEVALGDRSYTIRIGAGALDRLGPELRRLFDDGARRVVVVTDSGVAPHYLPRAEASICEAGFRVDTVEIPAGESRKNLDTLGDVYDRLLALPVDRRSVLVALGGGVVGDLTGFAAATVLRGIAFVQVPTTLLAQVDASVGGKTGINHPRGKNLIGAFHQPRLVLVDPATLGTLAPREYAAGLAEVVKYGASLDAALFREVESGAAALLAREPAILSRMIRRSCEIKAEVVRDDEREGGWRAVLNFGHTVGHAVEALTGYDRYLHGEAVSIGIVAAARVSVRLGLASPDEAKRIGALLGCFGLPTAIPSDLDPADLVTAIESDKKSAGGEIRFVVMKGLGSAGFERLPAERIVALAQGGDVRRSGAAASRPRR